MTSTPGFDFSVVKTKSLFHVNRIRAFGAVYLGCRCQFNFYSTSQMKVVYILTSNQASAVILLYWFTLLEAYVLRRFIYTGEK